ncbi:MAG: HAMP domain-containing histidine kinase [Agathobacter sp.]|nr:HAMP domain-containing histidine kinase [Agathobacter sp.]
MIKKMQRKFVLLSMSAFLLVLAIIITGINIVNYNGVVQEADMLLSFIADDKGIFPIEPDKLGDRLPPGMSPEIPYETRFFSVVTDNETNQILFVETSRIISVDQQTAVVYANMARNSNTTSGFIQNFRYQIHSEDHLTKITFLDCGRKLDAFQSFMFASIGISLFGYLIVFGLIAFFSNKIIRPISESYEKQKRFITDAGHEIKTPLTIIHADADVLEMDIGTNEWLNDIKKQANYLTELTNNLVFLSRMEEAQNSLPMIDFPFSEVVSESAASFQSLAQTKGITFTSKIERMLSFYGNEKSIRQLIGILLDNAIKYSPTGGTVSLTVEKQNTSLRLSVYNTTTQDISKEELKLLFDRFYRIDPSRNSQTGGHGIGLSLAKAIVTAHNGKIHASSKESKTLQINITLPV